MSERIRKALATAFLLMWFASLALPTLRTNNADWDPGWWLLVSGWMGLFVGYFYWLANPLLILSALFLLKGTGRKRFVIAGVPLLLLAAMMAMTTSLTDNEGGIAHAIEARYSGYWLWMAAIVLAGITDLLAALLPAKASSVTDITEPA